MGKRNSGEGGFFHDVKRGIWIYQLRYTDANGNRGRKKFAAKTKREAMQKGKDFIDSLNQVANYNEKLTVGNWIRNWLENYAKLNIRPRKSGLVSSNVVRLTKAPKLSKKEIAVLSKSEIARLIDTAKEIKNPFMSVVMPQIISLTVHTGMRQGEVFGLKWDDIDFEKSCLFIRRSLAHVIGKGAVCSCRKTLKIFALTKSGKKIIPKSWAICFRVTISFSPARSASR